MLTAGQEVGPYYVAYDMVREDIVGGIVGLPMKLEITVINKLTCKAIKNAAVEVWQCDPLGVYSDESSEDTRRTASGPSSTDRSRRSRSRRSATA
jgi:protocatechuate 3,4-dioxygenase beta subunit